jgi:phenylacetate-CoA ligase
MIWNTEESLPIEQLRALQSERLIKTVNRVYNNVPLYKERFAEKGVLPGDIKSIEDIAKLPFTVKQDLRDCYPYNLFASPMEDIVELHASSGTTGKQIVVGYTRNDLNLWGNVMARTFTGGGVGKHDIGHVSYGYGLFTGGLGAHYGSQMIGAATIPVSVGNTKRQVTILQDFKPTFFCATPSYALYIAETIEEMGVDPKRDLHLKSGFFGAEPWTENMRQEIEARLNLKAYDIYGLSEIIGPGVSFECECQSGLHVNEDHFYIEIIDPATGEPVPDGTAGEVVFTCLTKEALPLIRYRTRDIGTITREPCACGRTTCRMSKLAGRTDDMLIIRGINVFPSQVESVLLEVGETAPHYLLVVDRVNNLDTLEVQVELDKRHFSDEIRKLEQLTARIHAALESTLGIAVQVRLVQPKTIERSEGKAKRVIDKRILK